MVKNSDSGIGFIKVADYEELSEIGAERMIQTIKNNPKALLCLASGSSPTKAYEIFVNRVIEEGINASELRILKLDEWWGIPTSNPATCEKYLQDIIIKPLNISEVNYISFSSTADNPQAECERVSQILQEEGPIDLCILGLGKNGHLGLNEPASFLTPFSHVAKLDERTKTHVMLKDLDVEVNLGMTIGLADIMASRDILFMVTGNNKDEMFKNFMEAKVDCSLPASILWLHPNTICVHDL